MKVLIADDHPMVRDALSRMLKSIDPDIAILQASDYAQVEARLDESPDLLLLDIHMPGMGGVAGVKRLRERHPQQRIVVASGADDSASVRGVLALGVAGFVSKAEPAEVLVHALKLVLAGGTYTPGHALVDSCDDRQIRRADASGLTARQLEVLRLLMQGQPNKIIARVLGLTEGTVKIHIAAILRTLQARNRTEAVVMARRIGIQD